MNSSTEPFQELSGASKSYLQQVVQSRRKSDFRNSHSFLSYSDLNCDFCQVWAFLLNRQFVFLFIISLKTKGNNLAFVWIWILLDDGKRFHVMARGIKKNKHIHCTWCVWICWIISTLVWIPLSSLVCSCNYISTYAHRISSRMEMLVGLTNMKWAFHFEFLCALWACNDLSFAIHYILVVRNFRKLSIMSVFSVQTKQMYI